MGGILCGYMICNGEERTKPIRELSLFWLGFLPPRVDLFFISRLARRKKRNGHAPFFLFSLSLPGCLALLFFFFSDAWLFFFPWDGWLFPGMVGVSLFLALRASLCSGSGSLSPGSLSRPAFWISSVFLSGWLACSGMVGFSLSALFPARAPLFPAPLSPSFPSISCALVSFRMVGSFSPEVLVSDGRLLFPGGWSAVPRMVGGGKAPDGRLGLPSLTSPKAPHLLPFPHPHRPHDDITPLCPVPTYLYPLLALPCLARPGIPNRPLNTTV